MLHRTTLLAGQANTFTKSGRFFYLITAADKVRFKFVGKTLDVESDLREGMSADFPSKVDSVIIQSETAQYIEYWLGDTKLDYMSLAAGGAAAGIQSGRAVCQLGSSLAIPADFRRKKITLQALDDVYIGGIGVDASTGFFLAAGEKSDPINSRGDVYTYLTPASIDQIDTTATLADLITPADGGGYQSNTDVLMMMFFDKTAQRLCAGYGRITYSDDFGTTWQDSTLQTGLSSDPSDYFKQLGQTANSLFFVKKYEGRIGRSTDGGKSWQHFAKVQGSTNELTGLAITGCAFSYNGYVSQDEQNLIVIGSDSLWETWNGGKTWQPIQFPQTPNANKVDAVNKDANGNLFAVRAGYLYKWDYSVAQWVQKQAPTYHSGGDHTLIISNGHIYWYHEYSGVPYFYHSDDGGDTYDTIALGITNAKYIAQFGDSIVAAGIDQLAYIAKLGDTVVTVNSDTPSGKTYRGDRLVFTDESIIVKQANNVGDAAGKALVYPMSAFAGAEFPVPLQWLAEVN